MVNWRDEMVLMARKHNESVAAKVERVEAKRRKEIARVRDERLDEYLGEARLRSVHALFEYADYWFDCDISVMTLDEYRETEEGSTAFYFGGGEFGGQMFAIACVRVLVERGWLPNLDGLLDE